MLSASCTKYIQFFLVRSRNSHFRTNKRETKNETTIVSEKKNKCGGNNDVAVAIYSYRFQIPMWSVSAHRAYETNRKPKNKKK